MIGDVALAVDGHARVDALNAKFLLLGATVAGLAAARGEWIEAGDFRELDGNKLNVFCTG